MKWSWFWLSQDSTISEYKEYCYHNKEYDVDIYYSVLWDGTYRIYFHKASRLSGSAGCIHLLEGDAESFYNDVDSRTRVIFNELNK